MATVKVMIVTTSGQVLDEFKASNGPRVTAFTYAELSNDIRDYLEHRYEVDEANERAMGRAAGR